MPHCILTYREFDEAAPAAAAGKVFGSEEMGGALKAVFVRCIYALAAETGAVSDGRLGDLTMACC